MSLHPPIISGGVQLPIVTAVTEDSLGPSAVALGNPTSRAWGGANTAVFIPFQVQQTCVAYKMWYASGTPIDAAGHLDLGIYDEALNRLVSTGSTAQGAVTAMHTVDIADTTLVPGRYYMAMSCDSVTGQYRQWSGSLRALGQYDIWKMDTAFPLPATATFALMTFGAFPDIGITFRTQDSA